METCLSLGLRLLYLQHEWTCATLDQQLSNFSYRNRGPWLCVPSITCMGLYGCASTTLSFPILASVHVVDTKYRTRSNLKTEGFIRDHDLNEHSIVIRKTHRGDWLWSAEADAWDCLFISSVSESRDEAGLDSKPPSLLPNNDPTVRRLHFLKVPQSS